MGKGWITIALAALAVMLIVLAIRLWPEPQPTGEWVNVNDRVAEIVGSNSGDGADNAQKPGMAPDSQTNSSTNTSGEVGGQSTGAIVNGKIDINRANVSELDKLPGIGPTKAQAIVDYREQHGPFKALTDLMKVKGIGQKTYDKLKDQVAISQ